MADEENLNLSPKSLKYFLKQNKILPKLQKYFNITKKIGQNDRNCPK